MKMRISKFVKLFTILMLSLSSFTWWKFNVHVNMHLYKCAYVCKCKCTMRSQWCIAMYTLGKSLIHRCHFFQLLRMHSITANNFVTFFHTCCIFTYLKTSDYKMSNDIKETDVISLFMLKRYINEKKYHRHQHKSQILTSRYRIRRGFDIFF